MSFAPKTLTVIGALSAIALMSACSPGPVPVSQSPRDPSSPSAPEGSTPAVASAAAPSSDSEAHAHGHADSHANHAGHAGHAGHAEAAAAADGGTQGTVYVCPMDPEVTSNAPGICPKCNMKLVPKK